MFLRKHLRLTHVVVMTPIITRNIEPKGTVGLIMTLPHRLGEVVGEVLETLVLLLCSLELPN